MKKNFKFMLLAFMSIFMCVTLPACGDDDDNIEDETTLQSVIVGAWAQDGDNDIFVVKDNGTGIIYDSPSDYLNNEEGSAFTWRYSNGWVYAGVEGIQTEELRAESVAQNKIVWRRYEANPNLPTDLSYLKKDAFGYYELWTWERYTK